ncbi:DNA internalization-related competence protein ComEC/Rec2 [Alkalimarinus sediminis]|uniref:DNA internalization-related competence protein ComEC/Rec2 n=1 Tax=Alkalimarinus sediminis TaxID=1632866 RepID=A0A9E8KRJ2_9ALTE|nr:DNA internalization-related competence protein ComEC/Rec2 [Alkalimarinus sediminis]UZW76132.1 DNA internalization-related competence protein ComEC/Rec2 [Alkalimarinus sediminis]
MRSWMIAYVVGVVVFHILGELLPTTVIILLLLLSLGLFLTLKRARWLPFLLISLVWASVYSERNKLNAIDEQYEGINLYATGYVCSIPKKTPSVVSFELCDVSISEGYKSPELAHGLHIKLAWYSKNPTPLKGRETFIVRLKRPNGSVNPHSFLYEKWLFRKGINGVGYVKDTIEGNVEPLSFTGSKFNNAQNCTGYGVKCLATAFRIDINNYLDSLKESTLNIPLIKALSLGYRGDIEPQLWQVFKNTGTSHLIAISGLHIGLVFGFSVLFLSLLWRVARWLIPESWLVRITPHKRYLTIIVGLFCAMGYAAMAGFLVSTQRALLMLLVYYACDLSRQYVQPNTRLLIAAFVILGVDPNAVLDYGFWLSFLAVWALFFVTVSSVTQGGSFKEDGSVKQKTNRIVKWLSSATVMQWVIFIGLLPVLLATGIGVSYTSLLANFVAIPLVGMIIVPLILCGLITIPISSTISGLLIMVADTGVNLLFKLLDLLSGFKALNLHFESWGVIAALFVVAWVIILLPVWNLFKGWLVATIVLLLWFNPVIELNPRVEITLLDVGQGLSVVATKGHTAIVYDVGPVYRNGSAAERTVVPYLKAKGVTHIELLVISHGDDDHAGGLSAIEREFSVGRLISGQPERLNALNPVELCDDGLMVSRDWYTAEFYYPPAFSTKKLSANNHSCVVKLTFNNRSVLLMGDVEKNAERRLVNRYGKSLQADILVAGHHGSKNATTQALLNQVKPEQVLFSAGYRSRFRHPHPDAVKRASSFGSVIFNTAESGAIIIRQNENQAWQTTSYRDEINAFWLF